MLGPEITDGCELLTAELSLQLLTIVNSFAPSFFKLVQGRRIVALSHSDIVLFMFLVGFT